MNEEVYLKNFFHGKKVFITGHTGFKGSWLAIWLKELGSDVLGYSLEPPSKPNNFEATNLSKKIKHIFGDIRDLSYLRRIFHNFKPEFVFHLAAQPLVRYSYEKPLLTFETNVLGTVNMFEVVRKMPSVRVFINVTSDKVYENRDCGRGYKEGDCLGGYDPYSSSKACSELVSQAYVRSFFSNKKDIGVASVRAGNVIGGGDWGADRLLPDCVRALSRNKIILTRNPKSVRPWQYVLEPLYGYLLLAIKLFQNPKNYMQAWNFGPREESYLAVSEVVGKVINYWGSGKWRQAPRLKDNKHEMKLLKLNSDKASRLLNWRTILDIDTAIKITIEWYKAFYELKSDSSDMYDFSVQQINDYTQLLAKTKK